MTRKSKQRGGHNPLTYTEQKQYNKDAYGTTSKRLGKESQYAFANCCLSLHPALDHPVATPSGYIYERPAMLEYLLTKTQELKKEQQEYEQWKDQKQATQDNDNEKKRKNQVVEFENTQKVASAKKQKIQEPNVLKRSSFWLADMQPANNDYVDDDGNALKKPPPPKRPSSPNSQKPLRRKDLIELVLKRNKMTNGKDNHVLCAISEKQISTQQAVALITKGDFPAQVVLEKVFNDLGKNERICPVTGRKIKQILKLQKGGSSFASIDQKIEAKLYRPTMT
ncbi:MAG: nitric oxide synthase-interacting protein [Bacillariaceae sp.]|jgi:nitric oxide synthase-interacting protein